MQGIIRAVDTKLTGLFPRVISRVHLKNCDDPESLTEFSRELHFSSGGLDYIVRVHKPNVDGQMLKFNASDFYRMFFFGGLSEEQGKIISNAGYNISMLRLNVEARIAEHLFFDERKYQEPALLAQGMDVWEQYFSGSQFTWCRQSDFGLVKEGHLDDMELKNVLSYLDYLREIENPKPLVHDILIKFQSAVVRHREIYGYVSPGNPKHL